MENNMEFRRAFVIALDLYKEQAVWELVALENEMLRRYGEDIDLDAKTGAGRTRWRNICDHVKAQMTKRHLTVSITLGGKEYRVWVNSVGVVHGETLVTEAHLRDVLNQLTA